MSLLRVWHCTASAASLRHGRSVSIFIRDPGLWLANCRVMLSSDWLMSHHQCPLRLWVTAPSECCDPGHQGAWPDSPGHWVIGSWLLFHPQPCSILLLLDNEICLDNTTLSCAGLHAEDFQLGIQNRYFRNSTKPKIPSVENWLKTSNSSPWLIYHSLVIMRLCFLKTLSCLDLWRANVSDITVSRKFCLSEITSY